MAPKAKPGQQPPPDDDDDDEGGFTPKQLEQISGMISTQANAAVSSQLQRKLASAITTQLEAPLGEIRSMLEGITGAKPTGGDGKPKGDDKGAAGEHPEIATLKQRDAEREKRLKAIEDERTAERARARAADRDAKLRELATNAGVDKNRIRGVVALLGSNVKHNDDGSMTVNVQRDGYAEDVTLEAHAAEWFKSDEGKAYLAPPQGQKPNGGGQQRTTVASVAAGGARPGGTNNAPMKGQDAQRQAKVAEAHDQLAGAIGELLGSGSVGIG